jgi:hypothetical protein
MFSCTLSWIVEPSPGMEEEFKDYFRINPK